MIEREEMQEIARSYDRLTIGVIGSHSAEEVGVSAKENNLPVVVICEKGREELYAKHNQFLFDRVILVDSFSDLLKPKVQERLREVGTLFIPNRSFSVYVGYDGVESKFKVPMYGSRNMLRIEDRNTVKNQYFLMEKAGIRTPEFFPAPEDINKLSIVKVQQKDNPNERAFFYPTNPQEYHEQSEHMIKKGIISREGLEKARIEEFVIGPRFNANFHGFAIKQKFGDIDFLGFEDRIQTDLMGLLNLPAREQLAINIYPKNEEVGHRGVTMRESLKPMVYEAAEKFRRVAEQEYAPGVIGTFALQGALPYNKQTKRPEFVVFDVSPRIPGCPCIGPTSPEMRRLSIKYRQPIKSPLDLAMMEIKYAFGNNVLKEIVT
jgi:5-formaminoimidazole-4-carboxamide-1-(beta)-D-ribofuranosyl 5'-monophosphate synthetase